MISERSCSGATRRDDVDSELFRVLACRPLVQIHECLCPDRQQTGTRRGQGEF
jgi:hypothetical protein